MASITKGDFLDVLQGQRLKSSLETAGAGVKREIKVEPKLEPKTEPTWDQMSDSEWTLVYFSVQGSVVFLLN